MYLRASQESIGTEEGAKTFNAQKSVSFETLFSNPWKKKIRLFQQRE
jgi:hypothetical protein